MQRRASYLAVFLVAVLAAALAPGTGVAAQEGSASRHVTVVAVVDGGFAPYHFEFLGHRHPWNTDGDPGNDLDFYADPAGYVDGYPEGVEAIDITIPTHSTTRVQNLATFDADEWDRMERSTSADDARLYRLPGTKVIGAIRFSGSFPGTNDSHGTRTAASAAGNTMGSCPECLFVFVQGATTEALRWAVSQPWIDVVTNSYGKGLYTRNDPARRDPTGRTPRSVVRDNIFFGSPIDASREASERGQVVVFSAGNGLVNAFDVPMLTYWSSEKGPDWIVTVGAVSSEHKQTASGSGKPVDISSIGINYPSTGGPSVSGDTGQHSGTSNAAPVIAGYFAKTIQAARELLGDAGHGQRPGGVVATGDPLVCGGAVPDCALGDGVLTRGELEDLVFRSAVPSEAAVDAPLFPTWPTTQYAYHYQGHGVLVGRMDGADAYEAEWQRILGAATGTAAHPERPAGEEAWFVVDSKCRQRAWGSWSGGRYQGSDPSFDPAVDHLAMAWNVLCTALPENAFVGRDDPTLPDTPEPPGD